jgi:hypothetical protein
LNGGFLERTKPTPEEKLAILSLWESSNGDISYTEIGLRTGIANDTCKRIINRGVEPVINALSMKILTGETTDDEMLQRLAKMKLMKKLYKEDWAAIKYVLDKKINIDDGKPNKSVVEQARELLR